MDVRVLQAAIADTWFGGDMGEPSLRQLAEMARDYTAVGRTKLLREGRETTELSLVRTGRVALTEHVPGQGALTLMTVEAGDVFGWSALIDPYVAVASVTSLEPVEIIALEGARLRAAMAADHDLSTDVYRKILEVLARRLRATRHQLLDVHGDAWTKPLTTSW